VYGSDTATYTTKEAAERLGLEVSHVRRLLEEGKIEGKEFGRDLMVLGLDCERRRAPKREKGESNEKSQAVFWRRLRSESYVFRWQNTSGRCGKRT
jgi:excisionase family DNA binding protein